MGLLWCTLALLALQVDAGPRETVLTLNTVRALRQTADPFIGFSVSPQLLLNNHYSHSTLRMLGELSPAVLRVGDEESDKLVFRTANGTPNAVVFTEMQWAGLNRFAGEAGLGLVFSIGSKSDWKQLFNTSHRLGFSPSWQLGYKLLKNESGHEVGEGVIQLRQTLNSLLLQRSAILGPDFQVCDACDYNRQISEFFQEAGDYVNTVTLQLDPLESKEDDKLSKLIASVERAMARKAVRPGRFKIGTRRQIWIAEASGAEEAYTGEFLDAIRWALKLGVLAHAGAHSVLRRPTQLIAPTPDYWVSLLHRRLVGPSVLALRQSSTEPLLRAFAHCAASGQQPGAVTIWGVNYADTVSNVSLRVGARLNKANVYVLTRDTWEDAEIGSTLLNGRLLHLSLGELPGLSAQLIVLGRNMSVSVPPQSVFFIVLPVRAAACLLPPAIGLNYDLTRLQTVVKNNRNSDKIPSLGNNVPLTDVKNRGDFDLEKGGLYDTAEKERKSRDNVEEDLEKSSKLILESLKAHVNGYDKQDEETQLKNPVDTTLASINYRGSADETDTREGDTVQITTEDSRDGMSKLMLPMSLPDENGGQVGREIAQPAEVGVNHRDRDSEIHSFSLIPFQDSIKDDIGNEDILTLSFNPGQTQFPSTNLPRKEEQRMEDSKIIRIRRSENKELLAADSLRGIEDNLLRKRIQYLKRKRNMTKVQESNVPKNGTVLNPTVEHGKDHNRQNHYSSSRKNQIGKVSKEENNTDSGSLKINNPGNFHYRPGEFYETLGSLKIDSNVSLKDIEKADEEAIDSMIENSQQKKSGSKIVDKHSGERAVERKLDESTTENVEKYFKCDDDTAQRVTSGSQDKSGNDNIKCSTSEQNKEIEHSSAKVDVVKKKLDKEPKTEKPLESSMIPLKSYSTTFDKKYKTSRMKREIGEISNITQMLFPEGENSTKSNHSIKPQIGMYVMDQSEGRKLFLEATVQEQGLDRDRNNPKLYNNVTTTEPTKVKITVTRKNKTVEGEERNPNFFLLNNLVMDKSDSCSSKQSADKFILSSVQTALKGNVEGFGDAPIGPSASKPKVILETPRTGTSVKYHSAMNGNSNEKQITHIEDQPMSTSKTQSSAESNPNMGTLLRQLARKFSEDMKSITPTKTENRSNIHRLENTNLMNNKQDYGEALKKDEVKNSTNDKSDSLTDSILGLTPAFLNENMLSMKKPNVSLFDDLTKIHSSHILDGDHDPYQNAQNQLKGSGSSLISNIVQGYTLPPVNPAELNLTTESGILSSPLQKPKMNLHSSIHASSLPIPPVLPNTHINKLLHPDSTESGIFSSPLQKPKMNLHSSIHTSPLPIPPALQNTHINKFLHPDSTESGILSSPLQKPKMNHHSSIHASSLPIPPVLPNTHINKFLHPDSAESGILSSSLQKPKMNLHSSIQARHFPTALVLPKTHITKLPQADILNSIDKQEHTLDQRRPSTLDMLVSKRKEKLNALKLRIQQARERMLEARRSKYSHHVTNNPHASVVKRSIFTIGGENKIRGEKKIGFDFSGNKSLIKLLEDGVIKSSLPYETNSKHMTGQITNADMESTPSEEFSLPQDTPKSLETTENKYNDRLKVILLKTPPVVDEFPYKPQSAQSIGTKDKFENTNLDSGLVRPWELRRGNPDEDDAISRSKRKPRAVHYPCMKDLFFNDYDTEDQVPIPLNNVNLDSKRSSGLSLGKNAQDVVLQGRGKFNPSGEQLVSTGNNNRPVIDHLPSQKQSKKSKRSVDSKEMKMLEILSNKLMTDELTNYISENSEQIENFVQSTLHKTILNPVSGKSGISRMYALAKEYQKTNPESLEIFDPVELNTDSRYDEKHLDSLEGVNEVIEMQDDTVVVPEISAEGDFYDGTHKEFDGLNISDKTSPNPFVDTTTMDNYESMFELQETEAEIGNSEQSKSFIDSFIKKIEVIVHDITSTVKHGLL